MTDRWTFGVEPLPQQQELAAAVRRLTALALSLETPSAELDALVTELAAAEEQLARLVPADSTPRIGAALDGDGRAYIDHARDVGAFNACFPEYDITVDDERAWGTITFPLAYEGPPGIVHGGFLGVFFDSVVQHHNCDVGVAGKTTAMAVRYRRPTPLLTELQFDITRTVDGDRIASDARLLRADKVLSDAHIEAIAGDRSALPPVSPRRTGP